MKVRYHYILQGIGKNEQGRLQGNKNQTVDVHTEKEKRETKQRAMWKESGMVIEPACNANKRNNMAC